jgi:muconolactone delta-isomerase
MDATVGKRRNERIHVSERNTWMQLQIGGSLRWCWRQVKSWQEASTFVTRYSDGLAGKACN